MPGSFRKIIIILMCCLGMAALAQIPGTFPFAFLKSSLGGTCEAGSQAFGVGASTNSTDGIYDFSVPSGCKHISIKAWGAGGGSNSAANGFGDSNGGGGGFSYGEIAVTPGEGLKVVVGSGGRSGWSSGFGYNTGTFGGPGLVSGQASGGGYSGVHRSTGTLTQANALVIAGGGGSGGTNATTLSGGAGGGVVGLSASGANAGVGGGGSALKGTDGSTSGNGGGGGGYVGGAAGGSTTGGGGGGSGFIFPGSYVDFTLAGSGRTVANGGDDNYAGNAGLGGVGLNTGLDNTIAGGNGRVVISWGDPAPGSSVTIASNVTINSSNVANYLFKAVTINTGVVVTVDVDTLVLSSLNIQGTGKILLTQGKALSLVVQGNMTLDANAKIDGDGKGYAAGYTYGNTTTGAAYYGAGSHGGYGGAYIGNAGYPTQPYGSVEQPITLGAGGSATAGGGALKLIVGSTLALNGTISVNGTTMSYSSHGTGAGGSVWIIAKTIASSSSSVNIFASGGDNSASSYGSSGGGGRIAIYYESISGFTIDSTRVRAYSGSAVYSGGGGTIFAKRSTEVYGDLLISSPATSNYRNTKIGVFGQVSSISMATLNTNSNFTLLPGTNESLMGKNLKPDISLAATIGLSANAAQSLTAVSSLAALTAVGKYFYVIDYATAYKNVIVKGNAKVDVGYLVASENLEVQDTAAIHGYDIAAKNITIASGTTFSVRQKLLASEDISIGALSATATVGSFEARNLVLAGSVINVSGGGNILQNLTLSGASALTFIGNLSVGNNITSGSTSTLTASQWTVSGNVMVSDSSQLKLESALVAGTIVLSGTSKILTFDSTTTAIYGINILANNMEIASGAMVDVTGKGYLPGYTYGNTTTGAAYYGAGSHGGFGGAYIGNAGYPTQVFGNIEQPITAGAGGTASSGGGIIKLTVTSTLTLNGTISANGTSMSYSNHGNGAGGSIWITAGTIASSSSSVNISASGGNNSASSYGSGGGGGRIAIYYGNLSGFAVEASRVRAYGGTGVYTGGAGTIFSKQSAETYGDLLISGPTISNYRNTKIGVFGQVSSISTSTLNTNSNFPLLPGTNESLAGKVLKPDITLPGTINLANNANQSLTAVSSLAGLTSASKYFYVTDYATSYKNIKIEGASRVDAGLFSVQDLLVLQDSAQLNAYDISAHRMETHTGNLVTVRRNLSIGTTLNIIGTNLTVTQDLVADGEVNISSASVVAVGGSALLGLSLDLSGSTFSVNADMTIQEDLSASGSTISLLGTNSILGTMALSATTMRLKILSANDIVMENNSSLLAQDPTTVLISPIEIVASSIRIDSGSNISADGKGYLAGYTYGNTTTGAAYYGAGSHGGFGGAYIGNAGYPTQVFGSVEHPVTAGAGGTASSGGGIIKLTVTSTLTLNGTISANGTSMSYSNHGNGAGGSIWITAGTIASSSSSVNISASGGNNSASSYGSGGGGGRIAIYYGNLSGFMVESSRVRSYGGTGIYNGGAGTIYSKQSAETYGDLLVSGPTTSNYRNTKIGVFGQVSSISTSTLNTNSNFPLLPATNESLTGRTLKPDITQPTTISLFSNTTNSLTASSSLVALTAATKYFYVTDYATTYRNITLEGAVNVDAGYLYSSENLKILNTSILNAYDIDAKNVDVASGTQLFVRRKLSSTQTVNIGTTASTVSAVELDVHDLNLTGTPMTLSGALDVTGNMSVVGSSALDVSGAVDVLGDMTLGNTSVVKMTFANIGGTIALTGTSKIQTFNSTSSAIYGLSIAATNFNLATGTSIDVSGNGYLAGRTNGNTTTGAASYGAGSHAGYGGAYLGNAGFPTEVYGSIEQPTTAGAGGSAMSGGGIIKLTVTSTLTLNGTISANGTSGSYSSHGMGAGGSIWITAGTIASSSSAVNISASGGSNSASSYGSGGGGGRIALYYASLSGFTIDSSRVRTYGGTGVYNGGAGTVYSKNTSNGQSSLLYSGGGIFSNYGRTKITLTQPLTLENLKIESSAQVSQVGTTHALTINTLEIQTSGALEVPTNSAAGYGSWFQYSTLVGSPAPTEY